MVEIITVLVLLGILAVVALPRLFNATDFSEAGFHQQLVNGLRYAHKVAIASGCDVQVQVDSGEAKFDLYFRSGGTDTSCGGGGFTEPVAHPDGGGNYSTTASSGVIVSNDLTVTFDSAGTPAFSTSTVTVAGRLITIETVTGYVH